MTNPKRPTGPAQPSPPYGVPHVPLSPYTTSDGYLPDHIADAIEDVRRYGRELEHNGDPPASEFSIGQGRVVPWVQRRARMQRRNPQPSDGFATPYKGTSPPTGRGPVRMEPRQWHGGGAAGQRLARWCGCWREVPCGERGLGSMTS